MKHSKDGKADIARALHSSPGAPALRELGSLGFSDPQIQELLLLLIPNEHHVGFRESLTVVTGQAKSSLLQTLGVIADFHAQRPDKPAVFDLTGIDGPPFPGGLQRDEWLRIAHRQVAARDPEVIVFPEPSDRYSVMTIVNSSLTGHRCLTYLQAASVADALDRFTDLGVPHNLQSEALTLITCQLQVRRLCDNCKKLNELASDLSGCTIYCDDKCDHCNHTGYQGHVAVTELLTISEEVRTWITRGLRGQTIVRKAVEQGLMKSAADELRRPLLAGDTSLSEITSFPARAPA